MSGAVLVGEKSGHVIVREHANTGDGIVTALEVIALMTRTGRPASSLADAVDLWPQEQRAIPVVDRDAAGRDVVVRAAVEDAERRLNGTGRILVRPSGTEPVVRIMVEGLEPGQVSTIADDLAGLVRARHATS